MKKPEVLILVLALLATAAKIYCAWTTIGTVDVPYFAQFGKIVADRGVIAVYREVPIYNHPPGLTLYLGAISDWANGRGLAFARLLRLPGIAADLVVVGLLLWLRRRTGKPAWWALGLFAVSPVSFMITGFHGNFDPLIVLGLMLAFVACVLGRPAWAGVALGLTCQVKAIPLLIAPVFFFFWLHRQRAVAFTTSAVVTTLVGWSLPLCVVPHLFIKQVLGQTSIWGWWGLTYLLRCTGEATFLREMQPYSSPQMMVVNISKAVIIAAILAAAWLRRKEPAESISSTLAFAFLSFLVFAPGFGVQYFLWIAPFLLRHDERWYAAVTAAMTVGLFAFYTIISGGMPWNSGFIIQWSHGMWAPWLLVPWTVLIFCLASVAAKLFAVPAQTPKETPALP